MYALCRYLKGVLQANEQMAGASDPNRGMKIFPLMPPEGSKSSPQAEMQASETFVRLLCQYEPDAVLSFLQSQEAYRVQVSLLQKPATTMRIRQFCWLALLYISACDSIVITRL